MIERNSFCKLIFRSFVFWLFSIVSFSVSVCIRIRISAPIEFAKIRSDNIESVNNIPHRSFVAKSVMYIAANGLNKEFFGGMEPHSVFSTRNSTAPFYSLSFRTTLKGIILFSHFHFHYNTILHTHTQKQIRIHVQIR